MKFDYFVRNKKGEVQTGKIEAPNKLSALKTLQERDLIIIKLESSEKKAFFSKSIKIFNRVKRKDIFVFFRQLAILVESDVPLVRSLNALGKQFENVNFKEIIFELANDIDGGMSFSQAMFKHPKIFSSFSVNLIKSGELGGRLQESLIYLADYLEKEYYLISKVRGAMIYPAFILFVFVVIGVVVLVMVIPSLTSVFAESGQELPLPTKIVIGASNIVIKAGWLVLLVLIGLVVFVWKYKKTEKGKHIWDTAIIKIPVFGKILQKTYLTQLADNLSALVKGGVSIIESLNISGEVIGNVVFRDIIFKARDEVKSGKNISDVFSEHKEITPLFCQMIKTGEQTGRLDIILEKLSVFYNKEVDNIVGNITQLIEPILLVSLGLAVAVLVFAVYLPIYSISGGM
ncbi:MAG: type II secretion system F family protein [bacterium]